VQPNTVQRDRRGSGGPRGILPLVISQYMACGGLPTPNTGANPTSLSTLRGIVTNSSHGHNSLTTWPSLTWSRDEDRNNLGRYWWFGVAGILKGAWTLGCRRCRWADNCLQDQHSSMRLWCPLLGLPMATPQSRARPLEAAPQSRIHSPAAAS